MNYCPYYFVGNRRYILVQRLKYFSYEQNNHPIFLSKQWNINQKLRIEEHFTQTTEKSTP